MYKSPYQPSVGTPVLAHATLNHDTRRRGASASFVSSKAAGLKLLAGVQPLGLTCSPLVPTLGKERTTAFTYYQQLSILAVL